MFIDVRNLQERRAERDSQFEGVRDIRNGYLFEVNGSVAGDRDGLVWFKAIDDNSEPFQVFYNGIIGDLRPNMFVKIERNPKDPSRWAIIGFDTATYFDDQSTYEQLPSLSAIPAKEDYEWPPGFPGAKALNIFPRAITDFAVRPTSPSSMKARVYSGIYPGVTNYARFQGPVNTKDFTADVPGAGLARLAAISIDSTGTLNYTNGTTFVDGLPMPDASLPAVPASQMLISAVRLVNGMTAIEESNFDLEMRPLMANGTVNIKVSEIWADDFTSVSLQTDSSDNVTINTGTLTLPSDIIHLGDTDTKISFTDDDIEFTAGNLSMLKLTEAGQDLITLGPGSGDVDIDFNGDMFLQGSDGFVGVGPGFQSPTSLFHMKTTTGVGGIAYFQFESSNEGGGFSIDDQATSGFLPGFTFESGGSVAAGFGGIFIGKIPVAKDSVHTQGAAIVIDGRRDTGVALTSSNLLVVRNFGTTEFTIAYDGKVGLNAVTSPSTELDIGAGAMEFAEMTAPAAGAANTARLYAEDNAGTTRQRIKFSSGNAVTIAEDGGLQTYTPSNVVTDRSYDADATSVAELADVLGTLIADFQAAGVLG